VWHASHARPVCLANGGTALAGRAAKSKVIAANAHAAANTLSRGAFTTRPRYPL
jgi:hypothetical protein